MNVGLAPHPNTIYRKLLFQASAHSQIKKLVKDEQYREACQIIKLYIDLTISGLRHYKAYSKYTIL